MQFRKFIKTVPMKLYILLAAIVLFAFFSNDFGLVDIQKAAIILAAGVDRTEDGFALTAQIAVPKGSDRTTGGTSSVELETKAETVSECFERLFAETGWVPKLVFCNLIVIGEDAAKEDVFSYLNFFLRNEYMPDSCLLAVSEGRAGELISSQSAIDDASSLAITKLFSDASEKSGLVMKSTLKEFALGYYGVSKSGYLPYVRSIKQESSQAATGGGSGGSGGSEEEEQKVYSAQETAIFSEGKMVALLTPAETLAFSLLEGNVFTGNLTTERDGDPVTLTVLRNKGGAELSMKEGPTAKLSLSLQVRLCCRGSTAPIEDVASDTVPEEVLKSAQDTVQKDVESLWEKCKTCGCDLFNLKRSLYRSSLKKYSEWKDVLLQEVRPQFETKITSMK